MTSTCLLMLLLPPYKITLSTCTARSPPMPIKPPLSSTTPGTDLETTLVVSLTSAPSAFLDRCSLSTGPLVPTLGPTFASRNSVAAAQATQPSRLGPWLMKASEGRSGIPAACLTVASGRPVQCHGLANGGSGAWAVDVGGKMALLTARPPRPAEPGVGSEVCPVAAARARSGQLLFIFVARFASCAVTRSGVGAPPATSSPPVLSLACLGLFPGTLFQALSLLPRCGETRIAR